MTQSPTMISLPGYTTGGQSQFDTSDDPKNQSGTYKINPIVWMLLFLIVGYVGIRWVMED